MFSGWCILQCIWILILINNGLIIQFGRILTTQSAQVYVTYPTSIQSQIYCISLVTVLDASGNTQNTPIVRSFNRTRMYINKISASYTCLWSCIGH